MRLAAGAALLIHGLGALDASLSLARLAELLGTGVIGLLLIVGLFTPVAGVLAAVDAAWIGLSRPGDVPFWLMAGVVCTALVLLGPGAWSVDARLFGWKRVRIGNGNGGNSFPG